MARSSTPTLPYLSCFVKIFVIISRLMSIIGVKQIARQWTDDHLPSDLQTLDIATRLRVDEASLAMASTDFGRLVSSSPLAVLYPSSIEDIVSLVKFSYNSALPFKIAPRGQGHSCRGQAMVAENGVVIDMISLSRANSNNNNNNNNSCSNNNSNSRVRVLYDESMGVYYADVGGEQLWIDVLHATLEHGVAPVAWTDYLYLTVGGTLSNAGISGQAFRYGPQISNVYELDVITGKGERITCSRKMNQELFYAVLGGLGQFGIITRARIKLQPPPKRVKWVRMLYDDFSSFTRDQELLISLNGDQKLRDIDGLHYVEGSLILHQTNPNNWRSSFFSPSDQAKITSLSTSDGIIYCLEVAKYYYHDSNSIEVDRELEDQFRGLSFLPGFIFTRDVPFVEFLNRVRRGELELQSKGLWDVPHPWLNIFIPRSNIEKFSHVFTNIIAKHNKALGPILIYPLNRNKWDDKMSAVTPEEDVFYTVGLLHSSGFDDWDALDELNKEILKYGDENGMEMKQYLASYGRKEEWRSHFGKKWEMFVERKATFDPKMIMTPGQRIF